MPRDRDRLVAGSAPGLRSPGWLGRWPVVGVILFLIGVSIFGAIAYNVWTKGPLLQWDVPLAQQMRSEAVKEPPRIIELLTFGFFVGKELLQVIVVILSLYFLHKRYWPELAMLLIGSGGGALIWYALIGVFNRPRPTAQLGVVVTDPSFPSGHAISSVICYGLLAYFLISRMPSVFWKWLLAIATILTLAYIGYSRIFLGGHYLSDILAGYALGLAWAALVFTWIERLFLRRINAN